MRRLSAGLVALLLATTPVAHSQSVTNLELRGSLTASGIEGFGRLEPSANRRTIQVRLLVQDGTGSFAEVARETVALDPAGDPDGDGIAESRFMASFRSPAADDCKVVARFARTRGRDGARRSVTLPCDRPDFPTGNARLTDVAGGAEKVIDVEIADTDELRAFGLMYKRRLAGDRGMAFLYNSPSSGGYWMKNTLIPLSIAFFDASGVILRIMHMEPCTPEQDRTEGCPSYDPETSYMGALEVNQGAFEDWGINEGDVVTMTRD